MFSLAAGPVLAQSAGAGASLAQFIPYLLIVVVFYLLLIRPQQRKARQQQQLIASIGPGDRVVTIGGIHGTVQTIDNDTAIVEISPGTSITLARAALARRLVDAEPVADDTSATDPADPTDTP